MSGFRPEKKFQLFVDNSVSVHTMTWAMLGSAVGQADDSPTGYGQESGRVCESALDLPWDARRPANSSGRSCWRPRCTRIRVSIRRYDPAFFHAVKYSVQRVFVTRNDDGRDVANWSGLAGH